MWVEPDTDELVMFIGLPLGSVNRTFKVTGASISIELNNSTVQVRMRLVPTDTIPLGELVIVTEVGAGTVNL